jgi:hypothetical protein
MKEPRCLSGSGAFFMYAALQILGHAQKKAASRRL